MVQPEELGLDPTRLERAYCLVQLLVDEQPGRGAAMLVSRRGKALETRAFGRMGTADAKPVQPDTIFLIASPTKPVTASAVCLLVERGLVSLDQPVREIIPELTDDKKDMQVLHILTHTSGLPDGLPDNHELRTQRQPFEAFLEAAYTIPLDFPPGTGIQYQSLGFALQAEIVRRITGTPLPEFLATEVFGPLGMTDTFLGRTDQHRSRIADVFLTAEYLNKGWTWNEDYWHAFGAPWGGLFSTVSDYERLLRTMLDGGALDGTRVFSPATTARMTTNNLRFIPGLSESDRASKTWGLGWMLRQSAEPSPQGSLVSERTFGHWGVTGTVVWADPDTGLIFVLFTNQPDIPAWLGRVSNAVAASVVD